MEQQQQAQHSQSSEEENHQQQYYVPQTTSPSRPVLATASTGFVVGSLVGYMLGMGSIAGGTVGAVATATLASRDDQIGERSRNVGITALSKANELAQQAQQKAQQHELGRDVQNKLSEAVQRIASIDAQYQVSSKLSEAGKRVVQQTRSAVEPKAISAFQTLREKAIEKDPNLVAKVEDFVMKADSTTGFSVAVARTRESLLRELKM
jgi:hypothetical protein